MRRLILLLILIAPFSYIIAINKVVEKGASLEVRSITLTTKDYTYLYFKNNHNLKYSFEDKNLNNIRKKLEKEIDLHFYIYIGKNHTLNNGMAYGYTNFYLRTIKVDEKQSWVGYTWTVAHEMIHLKYYTADEMWTNFMTFKILYYSEDPDFHQTALNKAYEYISSNTYDEFGHRISGYNPSRDYDISYWCSQELNVNQPGE